MQIVFKMEDGKYKIPRLIRYKIRNNNFKFEYKKKLYDKEIDSDDKEVKQISLLTEALNIKKRKERLKFVYDKACELLDGDFYGKNICEFKNNICLHDRIHNGNCDGCCRRNDNNKTCKYLKNHRCSTKNLACKLHICDPLKKKGYRYRINDIYILKYLYSWKQKLFIYTDLFLSEKEVLSDIYKNSILYWALIIKKQGHSKNKDDE